MSVLFIFYTICMHSMYISSTLFFKKAYAFTFYVLQIYIDRYSEIIYNKKRKKYKLIDAFFKVAYVPTYCIEF